METFNTKLKKEICLASCKEHGLSFLSGLIKCNGELKKNGSAEQIVIKTECVEVLDCVNKVLLELYGQPAELVISDDIGFTDRPKYEILLPSSFTHQILLDTEIAFYDEEKFLNFYSGISKYIVETNEQTLEYIRGVYIGSGTSNIVLSDNAQNYSKNTGYRMEFVFSFDELSSDFASLLAGEGILSKRLTRKEFFVVYVQGFEYVSKLIGLLGATKCYMDIQNENALREMRNTVNRQNNCQTANITKTVNASVEQLASIKTIQETVGIESLDEPLRLACYLRLANPDESLENLVKLSTEKISKSGLYHRFKKIEKIAKEIES